MNDVWLIWSNEHRAWWRDTECGYVSNRLEAGRYSQSDAERICAKANAFIGDNGIPEETMVRDF